MKVEPFSVGPIVGATTHESVRIFGRGEHEPDRGRPRRLHAVLRLRPMGGQFGRPRYTKLNPNFDMTGVIVLSGLHADTLYEYQAGFVFSDVASRDIDLAGVLDWSQVKPHTFRSGARDDGEARNLVVGSCRYLLRLFGGSWFDDRGDKTFRSIGKQLGQRRRLHALLMVGDQIYADDLNVLAPDQAIDEFNRRYQIVFSQEHVRTLMASLPTYMTLDDHEIEDNWPAKASLSDYVTKFPAAIHAYQTYQLSHSPLHPVADGRITAPPDHLWYTHRDGCCDFFFMDTRTERDLDGPVREMVSEEQLVSLLDWLADGSGRVKVVATSVPFWESESDDKWHGFPEQRDRILEHIRERGIQRVLILSGDVHASMSSELRAPGHPGFKIVSVVSSAFFWPYPHPFKRSFHLAGPIQTNTGIRYRVRNASEVRSTDNFTILRVDREGVRVQVRSRKGALLGSKRHRFA